MKQIADYLTIIIMFWNLENFFYPRQNIEHFSTEKQLTWSRFKTKRNIIGKTILAVKDAEKNYPSLIGLCEVENIKTIYNLLQNTPLAKIKYKILHKDSPDKRGIDVALLYREDISLVDIKYLRINKFNTRDILYAKMFSITLNDTLHVFVNHWPSKLGGERKSSTRRMETAQLLKKTVDSILSRNSMAQIIAMGDFNEGPNSPAVKFIARPHLSDTSNTAAPLINLMVGLTDSLRNSSSAVYGTYKYKGAWEILDQFLVSERVRAEVYIVAFSHLLQSDRKYLGSTTNKTFNGLRFAGGASDHLPIILKIRANEQSK